MWASLEETRKRQQARTSEVVEDFTRRNMMRSGMYLKARADVLVQFIEDMGRARMESLLKAYDRQGLPFDDAALREITTEVNQYCHAQQHHAVGAISRLIGQTFTGQTPVNLRESIVKGIESGVSGIMARLTRELDIRRDELILDEMKSRTAYAAGLGKRCDVFISHASEDKDDFVRPLAAALNASGLLVWYDETTLKVGDILRRKIDEGLANSRYGIVVLSHPFFAKEWPQQELDGLMSRDVAGTKVILPVWHNITAEEVRGYSPMLAARLAAKSNEGMNTVVAKLREAMGL
ncbi:MAG TPA: toll/interleukin-1 receptor domain-containing protein [Candidatus Acidoferrum sp.]|nr:toll/interleukin-1 receptor domain-containing protein [Candidatus Acidoferrum sp.]